MRTGKCQRQIATTLMVASVTLWACSSGEEKQATPEPSPAPAQADDSAEPSSASALVEQIGVEPGPVPHNTGPTAVIAEVEGQVELRRLGQDEFAPAKSGERLYQGDQVRAGEQAHATVLFPDESTAELAEVSTLAIGSRTATADPASTAAVLSGVARFSVSPRAPGEGPFLAFTPAGVVATKGTVFGVGVAANGEARVGVESGAVEVAGGAAFDAPVGLDADHALDLSAKGEVAAPAEWPQDDWGAWRDRADAEIQIAGAAEAHADAMAGIASELDATYRSLAKLDDQVATFEAGAAADASADASAQYEAKLPAASVAIDASFLTALRLEYLTQAYASHAVLAGDLYVRHPDAVAWKSLEPRLQAAVLWPKRLEATASAYFEPLRVQYYIHHPRGRAHAQWVGVAVPKFYASVTPPEVPAVELKKQLAFKAFTPPRVAFTASARPLWIAAPAPDWRGKATFKVQPPRGKVAFWVRPPQLKAHALVGMKIKHELPGLFMAHKGQAHAGLKLKHKFHGPKIKLAAPDLHGAAQMRAKWEGPSVPQMHGQARAHGRHELKAKLEEHAKLVAPRAKLKAASAQVQIKGPAVKAPKLKLEAKTQAKAKAKANAPKLKAEAKAHVGFKLGH